MTIRMTADEAVQFSTHSPENIATILDSLTCSCQPYIDTFTFVRWKAQGRFVRRGERGIRVAGFRPITKIDDFGDEVIYKIPQTRTVFCRCQTEVSGA